MRIAISGTAGLGKTTLVKDFLDTWPQYKTSEKTYREELRTRGLTHSKQTNKETQKVILDWLVAEQKKYRKGDKIVFDRCSLDNLVYSLWAFEKGVGGIDKAFIDECIPLVRESLRFIDIIFFIPITRVAPVDISGDNKDIRETDPLYIQEIDAIFKAMCAEWLKPTSPFVARDDKPAIIDVFGSRQERIQIMKLYLDNDGDSIGEGAIINPNEIEKVARELGVSPGEDLIKSIRLSRR